MNALKIVSNILILIAVFFFLFVVLAIFGGDKAEKAGNEVAARQTAVAGQIEIDRMIATATAEAETAAVTETVVITETVIATNTPVVVVVATPEPVVAPTSVVSDTVVMSVTESITTSPTVVITPTSAAVITATEQKTAEFDGSKCSGNYGEFAGVWKKHADRLGCSKSNVASKPTVALVPFEKGAAYWVSTLPKELAIMYFFSDGTWVALADDWDQLTPITGPQAPVGFFVPQLGIGHAWAKSDLLGRIGFATAAEEGFAAEGSPALILPFEGGGIFRSPLGRTYILFSDGTYVVE